LVSPRERCSSFKDIPFNAIVYRYFKDLQASEPFHQSAKEFISKQVNAAYRPDFIGPFTLEKLDFSTINFRITDFQFSRMPDNPNRVVCYKSDT